MGRALKLRAREVAEIPVAEVSALALRTPAPGAQAPEILFAAGDRNAELATASLPEPGPWSALSWTVSDMSTFPGADPSHGVGQVEALAAAGTDQLLVVREHPNVAVLISGQRLVAGIRLEVDPRGPVGNLAQSWADPGSSHGEGVVLLAGGHVLVAKEKDPLAIIEFGPAGDLPGGFGPGRWLPPGADWLVPGIAGATGSQASRTFQALASWRLRARIGDLSDATVTSDGRLLLLSDQDCAIYEVSPADPGDPETAVLATFALRRLEGKPEGLVARPDGSLLVATDTRAGRENLYVIDAGWQG